MGAAKAKPRLPGALTPGHFAETCAACGANTRVCRVETHHLDAFPGFASQLPGTGIRKRFPSGDTSQKSKPAGVLNNGFGSPA